MRQGVPASAMCDAGALDIEGKEKRLDKGEDGRGNEAEEAERVMEIKRGDMPRVERKEGGRCKWEKEEEIIKTMLGKDAK